MQSVITNTILRSVNKINIRITYLLTGFGKTKQSEIRHLRNVKTLYSFFLAFHGRINVINASSEFMANRCSNSLISVCSTKNR